jgi:hypothetical protein
VAVADAIEATIAAYRHQHVPSANLAGGTAELALSCVPDTA